MKMKRKTTEDIDKTSPAKTFSDLCFACSWILFWLCTLLFIYIECISFTVM